MLYVSRHQHIDQSNKNFFSVRTSAPRLLGISIVLTTNLG